MKQSFNRKRLALCPPEQQTDSETPSAAFAYTMLTSRFVCVRAVGIGYAWDTRTVVLPPLLD